ncbi:MAG: hypothetical protein CBB69_005475 [Phycisphaera sp. TMED9]|nr:MAG: hypothetical protein CBB69_005475 [Phycisphaera sp. TMED9]
MGFGEEVNVKSEGGELDEPDDRGREDHRNLSPTHFDADKDSTEELGAECDQGKNEPKHQVD